jgi:hypothetical protein
MCRKTGWERVRTLAVRHIGRNADVDGGAARRARDRMSRVNPSLSAILPAPVREQATNSVRA